MFPISNILLGVGPSLNFQFRAEPSQNFSSQIRAELFSSQKFSSRAELGNFRAEPEPSHEPEFPKISLKF